MIKKHKKINIGSVSSGTLRAKDLIQTFIWEIRHQEPTKRAHIKLCNEIERRFESDETVHETIDELIDALNEYAPPYFYFGAHPVDGADFGFWLPEGFATDYFDGLRVSDLADVPTGHSGEVLVCNDHGNMSLYKYARGRGFHQWGIV